MEHTLQQYVNRFLHVNTVTYQTWKANFASPTALQRLRKRGCLRRAYLCFLTMLENDYEYEKSFLSKSVPQFVKTLEEESGRKVKRQSDAYVQAERILVRKGRTEVVEWAKKLDVLANSITTDTVLAVCDGNVILDQELKVAVSKIQNTGN
eukprot:3535814-Rhodomonas_salina.1